jgi:hypothetical protein
MAIDDETLLKLKNNSDSEICTKVYEPKECYILVKIENNTETSLVAEEMQYYKGNEVLIRLKNDWYIYDLQTNQKKLKTKS